MFGDRGEQHNPAEPEEFYRRMAQDWYYRPGGPPPAGARAWLPLKSGGTTLTPFELYDDVTPGSTDKYAWTLNSDYSRNTSAGHTSVQVSDQVLGDVRAYGSSHTGWSSTRGALGFYAAGTDGKNQIVAIRRLAKMIKITTPSGSGGYAANATISGITSVTVLDDGQDPKGDASSISVTNWNQQTCNAVDCRCLADGSGGYLVIDADCPPSGGCP